MKNTMGRLIKNQKVILDGTKTRTEKEHEALAKLERIEKIMEKNEIKSLRQLDERLAASNKKVNLAQALSKNKKCIGYVLQMRKGKYQVQNDNDLGLDLEGIDCKQRYNKKVYVGNGYYYYVMWGLWGYENDNMNDSYVSLNMATLLLKSCHSHLFQLTPKEKKRIDNYWKQF